MNPRISLLLVLALTLSSLPVRAIDVAGTPGAAPHAGPAAAAAVAPRVSPTGVPYAASAADLRVRYDAAKVALEAKLAGIAAIPAEARTFANTVQALEDASADFDEAVEPLKFQGYGDRDKDIRDAAQALEEESGKYRVTVRSRDDLYKAVSEYAAKKEALPEDAARLLDSYMNGLTASSGWNGFKIAGHGLTADKKARVQQISERLEELQARFAANIGNDKSALEVTPEQLKGAPEDFIKDLEKKATTPGKLTLNMSYPHADAVMTYVDDSEVKRQYQLLFKNRAADKNLPLLAEALELRREQAQLLGFKSFPQMVLSRRTIETPEKAEALLTKVWETVKERGARELAAVLERKRKDHPGAERVEPWEGGYYAQKLFQERFGVDEEKIREYFPASRVVSGTMKVYERLFGIKFTEIADDGAWHKDARLFRVDDAATGKLLGHIHLDLFPRPGEKFSHAAVFPLRSGGVLPDGSYRTPVAAMMANFAEPKNGKPSLLSFDEAQTFFHEFGHLMHHTLTEARFPSQAGTNVSWDFVEAPSQMLENFVWVRAVVDEISGHYLTGEKLPEEIFQRMKAGQNYNKGLRYLRQVALAMIDLMYHTAVPKDTTYVYDQVMQFIGLARPSPGTHPEASFGHIMGGYQGGYNSYMIAEDYSVDAWTAFDPLDIFNPVPGMRWRKEVLARGSDRPELKSLEAFLGRPTNSEAFLKRIATEPDTRPSAAEQRAFIDANRRALRQAGSLAGVIGIDLNNDGSGYVWTVRVDARNADTVREHIGDAGLQGKVVILPVTVYPMGGA